MLLRSKSHLVNSNILHLTYTLVGTVDSEQESSTIPNLIAFKDLLAGKGCLRWGLRVGVVLEIGVVLLGGSRKWVWFC